MADLLRAGVSSPLVEREAELALLDHLLAEAAEGLGSMLVLSGPPGVGKTRLIAEAHERAEARGATALRARAGELERDFSHGVVRQLFEPAVARATGEERVKLFAGAAGPAGPPFGLGGAARPPGGGPSF